MTRSPWQREAPPGATPDPLPSHTDVLVIGAGIAGAATAWALREEAPDRTVTVVDAVKPAAGASGRNAGFLLLGTHVDYASAVEAVGRDGARALWQFTRDNLALACRVADTDDVGLSLTGTLIAAGSKDEADRLRRSHYLLAEDGQASVWMEPDAVEQRIGPRGLDGGVWIADGGGMDPHRLVRAVLRLSGARISWPHAVVALEPDGEDVCVQFETGGEVRASAVVVATNALLPRLLPDASDWVRPVRAQMLATEPLPPLLTAPVYSHEGYYYARQRTDGRVLVGGARHLHRDAEVGYDDVTTDALQADLEAYLVAHLPEASGAAVEQRWSGTMGFSPDGLPVVGAWPGCDRLWVIAGFTGHGMGMGLRAGRLVARRLLGREDPMARWLAPERRAGFESGTTGVS